jgi:hypothetical protein
MVNRARVMLYRKARLLGGNADIDQLAKEGTRGPSAVAKKVFIVRLHLQRNDLKMAMTMIEPSAASLYLPLQL